MGMYPRKIKVQVVRKGVRINPRDIIVAWSARKLKNHYEYKVTAPAFFPKIIHLYAHRFGAGGGEGTKFQFWPRRGGGHLRKSAFVPSTALLLSDARAYIRTRISVNST